MKLKVKIQGKEYEVEIEETARDKTRIKVGEKEFLFEEKKDKKTEVAKTSLPKRDFKKKEIQAPIAGTVSGVFVKEGDFIKRGQKVLLLSAMKMENEIISDFKGKVKNVLVKKEQKVKEQDILIVLE